METEFQWEMAMPLTGVFLGLSEYHSEQHIKMAIVGGAGHA